MRERTARLIDVFASISHIGEFAPTLNGQTIAFTQHVNNYHQIFSIPIDNPGFPRRITASLANCTEPQWSPDGQYIAYTQDHTLWIANADGSHAHEIVDHLAGSSCPRWSPDGTRIAFLSRRRGWTHSWIIAPNGESLTQVTRGEFDVADPTWSPDGEWLAYTSWRTDNFIRKLYIVSSHGGDEQLISPRDCWSGAPSFSPDGKTLAYVSDREGWFHIYLHDLQSHTERQLTSGEVEDCGSHFYDVDVHGGPMFSPDGKTIAFIRHREGKYDLWIVDVTTSETSRISSRNGYHRIVGWLPDSERIGVTFSNPTAPNDLLILSTNGQSTQVIDSSVTEIKTHANAPEWISYSSHDGMQIPAAILRPLEKSRAPAIVFIHGGPNFAYNEFFYPLPQVLAQEGYVVLLPNYRGSTGYGSVFREANFREWGHADALDVIAGARWLQQQAFVDPNRIAVVGPSYGGYLTLCALTLAPEIFCAGVDMYGDSELTLAYRSEDRETRMDLQRHMGTPEENRQGYRRGSPLYSAERIQAPLLILHGKDDMLVTPLMSEKMIEQLKIESKYYEAHFYEGEEHGFEKPENKKDVWERIVKFLNRYCKDEKESRY